MKRDQTAVVVKDVEMPFFSMVGFMVKWSLASIPAVLLLVAVGVFAAAFFAALGSAQ